MLKICYQPYKWLIYLPLVFLNTLVMGGWVILLSFINGSIAGKYGASPWARMALLATPAAVRIRGAQHVDAKQSYVVVANHVSQCDIFVLYGWLDLDIKWVMKAEMRKVPVIGAACAAMGHIFIDRSDSDGAMKTLRAAKKTLVAGKSVVFFPEGTRSRDGKMLPFKAGAFVMAKDLGLPILPITIKGTGEILPSDTLDLYPGMVDMVIHPAISTERVASAGVRTLIREARSTIAGALEEERQAEIIAEGNL